MSVGDPRWSEPGEPDWSDLRLPRPYSLGEGVVRRNPLDGRCQVWWGGAVCTDRHGAYFVSRPYITGVIGPGEEPLNPSVDWICKQLAADGFIERDIWENESSNVYHNYIRCRSSRAPLDDLFQIAWGRLLSRYHMLRCEERYYGLTKGTSYHLPPEAFIDFSLALWRDELQSVLSFPGALLEAELALLLLVSVER